MQIYIELLPFLSAYEVHFYFILLFMMLKIDITLIGFHAQYFIVVQHHVLYVLNLLQKFINLLSILDYFWQVYVVQVVYVLNLRQFVEALTQNFMLLYRRVIFFISL